MLTSNIADAELFKDLCALDLSVQLSMLEKIRFNLSLKLLKLCLISVFVVNQVLQDEYLVVIDFIDRNFPEMFDNETHVFPHFAQSCL